MISMFSGLPGSGKSYILTHEIIKAMKIGRPVFSNFKVLHPKLGGCYKLDIDMIKDVVFPEGSLLVIDEAGMCYNSRDWKKFDIKDFEFFTQHRHQGYDLLLGVQHPNRVDVSIREVVNIFYWVQCWKIPIIKRPLFFKAVGYAEIQYLGRTHIPKEIEKSVVFNRKFVWFRKKISQSYNTHSLRQNQKVDMSIFERWEDDIDIIDDINNVDKNQLVEDFLQELKELKK